MTGSGYVGIVAIDSSIDKVVVAKNASSVPTDADSLPTYRIYGPAGIMSSGSLSYKDTGSITGATNASPTVITSAGHGLVTGVKVTIASVGGNTGTNGTYDVTVLTSNTFSVAVNTGAGGAYTTGGTWHATGVYDFTVTPTLASNYAAGVAYNVVIYGTFSSTVQVVDSFVFQVS